MSGTKTAEEQAEELAPFAEHPEDCKINDGPGSRRIQREGPGCNCGASKRRAETVAEIAAALSAARIETAREAAKIMCMGCQSYGPPSPKTGLHHLGRGHTLQQCYSGRLYARWPEAASPSPAGDTDKT